ncbi:polyprenyl synthetase family protein [Streptomyces sp. NPDC056500]|uniref:polyprenyl synthetase family protein n=1 Tax=Streptomyces sp. NPDC056500 TaxID=3345840 RepID=UPI00368D25AD
MTAPPLESATVDLLTHARTAIRPVLDEALALLPQHVQLVVEYHLARRDPAGNPISAPPGGKAIRPALVLAAARATGGSDRDALRAAAAVELVHDFTLLHDDVIDRDPMRRHRPAAWTVFGTAAAIVAGDALAAAALRLVTDQPAQARRLCDCVTELCEGQYADTAFEIRTDVTLTECLAMAEAKTGALLGTSCAIGALAAGAPDHVADALDAFGRDIGIGFQLVDDLLGIWGDPDTTGKPAGADLATRKKSLPVVAALQSNTPAAEELTALYFTDTPLTPTQLARAAHLVETTGARDWAQHEAARRTSRALEHLAAAIPDPARTGDLITLAELTTRRNR